MMMMTMTMKMTKSNEMKRSREEPGGAKSVEGGKGVRVKVVRREPDLLKPPMLRLAATMKLIPLDLA